MSPATETGEKLLKHQADFVAPPKPQRKPEPRVGDPAPEPQPVALRAEAPILTRLREACSAGEVGTLTAHRGQLAPVIDEFAGTGLSQRVGFLNSATVITISRELRDVLAAVSSSGMWLRGAERFAPEFGRAAVTDADLLRHINSLIDRNATAALPVLVLLDESVGFEDADALRELARSRRVCVARVVETDDVGAATWEADR